MDQACRRYLDFDYNILTVRELAMEAGVNKPHHLIHRFLGGTGSVTSTPNPATIVFENGRPIRGQSPFGPVFLDDLKRHLEQKGWFDKTYLGINENPFELHLGRRGDQGSFQ